MRWEEESYVRFYTRNQPEWLALSWHARGLFGLLMREVDRAGILSTGKLGLRGVAVAVSAPWADVEKPLRELLEDGCVTFLEDKGVVFIPNFLEAQEVPTSDAARKRKSREMARAALHVLEVTKRDQPSQNVTESHDGSRDVTPGHSVLNRADLNRALQRESAREDGAQDVGGSGTGPSPSPPRMEPPPALASTIRIVPAPAQTRTPLAIDAELSPRQREIFETVAMNRGGAVDIDDE